MNLILEMTLSNILSKIYLSHLKLISLCSGWINQFPGCKMHLEISPEGMIINQG